jgi:putative glutamine amidotransferase
MAQTLRDRRPLIGITGPRLQAAQIRSTPEILLGADVDSHYTYYPTAVAAAGGLPVHLTREGDPEDLVARLDGLVIAGGQDVDPRFYGRQPTAVTSRLDPVRDRFEAALILAAIERGIPVVGICRGAQLMNVALGGTLVIDLVARQEIEHARWIYPPDLATHEVFCRVGTLAREIYGEEISVNSFHHQAIGDLGRGVAAAAVASDGTIEAIEIGGADAIGVQWHPEMLGEPDGTFEWLVSRARNMKGLLGPVERRSDEHCSQAGLPN